MKYGVNARVGNLIVFSPEGAVNAYRVFCERFNKEMSLEASAVVTSAMLDMCKLGFTPDECEAIEISTL